MAREKFQAYLEEDSAAFLDALISRYGWSATQAIDRLLRYYNTTQKQAAGYFVVRVVETNEEKLVYEEENAPGGYEDAVYPALSDIMDTISEGLTPRDGFAAFGEEKDASHE